MTDRSPLLLSKREARRFQALIDRAKEEIARSMPDRTLQAVAVLAFIERTVELGAKEGGGK